MISEPKRVPKTLLLSFADGTDEFVRAGERLEGQAKRFGLFSEVVVLDAAKVASLSEEYASHVADWQLLDRFPIYFRAAKAFAVKAALEGNFGDFDVVLYVDAGCELNFNSWTKQVLEREIISSYNKGGLAEQIRMPEYLWTKPSLARALNSTEENLISGQMQATWSFWRVNSANLNTARLWCELSNPDLGYWQDPREPCCLGHNHNHRRDQSIFSLLWKKLDMPSRPYLIDFETGGAFANYRMLALPILTIRNRTGHSQLALPTPHWILCAIAWSVNWLNARTRFLIFSLFQRQADLPNCFRLNVN